MYTYIAITCLLSVASAAPYGSWGLSSIESYSNPNYEFNYAVNDPNTGDHKAQSEVRNGDTVKGSYSLAEPDGTIRVVDYTADAVSGFNAVVKRIGAAQHPATIQVSAPVISKPIATSYLNFAPVSPAISSYSTDLIGLGSLGGLDWGGLGLGSSWGLDDLGLGGWKH